MSYIDDFRNEAFTDFSKEEHAADYRAALETVSSKLGACYPLFVNGQEISTNTTFDSLNPSQPSQVIGSFQKADSEIAEQAIQAAHQAFPSWAAKSFTERAQYFLKAADIMKQRKFELAAWMTLEAGKSWAEADGDVAEAIDFLIYYAKQAIELDKGGPTSPYAGEKNNLTYISLGVGAVIPPWNFPLAILVGMSSAAMVSGNTVVLKPSSDAPAIAWQFVAIMREVGVPDGVLNFIPGSGEEVGEYMVKHPLTRFISFTGSKAVGLHINQLAAETQPGQKWIKRLVAEMGGKDGIVVAEDADIEAAASGIVAAAFGFSGQKCSACSRAIIVEDVYDAVVEKVVEKTKALNIGDVRELSNTVGPVINPAAYKKNLSYIEKGKQEGRLLTGGEATNDEGYFIQPTVFADVDSKASISQEEIFGPVLAITKAKNYHEALAMANDTDYGLTGAVYSQSPEKLEQAKRDFHVGNLYLNRKCTGALVGVHPFGGFNMSGTDSKAGGPDYLLLFTQAKSITEKVG